MKTFFLTLVFCFGFLSNAGATERAFLSLKINGNDIPGFSSFTQIGGEDLTGHIELKSLEYEFIREPSRGTVSASPFKLTKYLDSATPLIAQGMAQSATIEAEFKIFGVNPIEGTTVLVATYRLTGGRIASTRLWLAPTATGSQLCEEVQISYTDVEIEYTGPGAQSSSVITPSSSR